MCYGVRKMKGNQWCQLLFSGLSMHVERPALPRPLPGSLWSWRGADSRIPQKNKSGLQALKLQPFLHEGRKFFVALFIFIWTTWWFGPCLSRSTKIRDRCMPWSFVSKITNPKQQITNKTQISILNDQNLPGRESLDFWILVIGIFLIFAIWNFNISKRSLRG